MHAVVHVENVRMAEERSLLGEELRVHAASRGQSPAILAPGRQPLTFPLLWDHVEAIAGGLKRAGLGREDIVAAALPHDAELLTALLSVVRVCTFAPLNPALKLSEAEEYLTNLHPAALIAGAGQNLPVVEAARRMGVQVLEALPTESLRAGLFTLCCQAGDPGTRTGQPDACSPALLMHTSATAGRAKLVALTHVNLRASAWNSTHALELTDRDRLLSMMPLFHLQGLQSAVQQLLLGGSVVCTGPFDAAHFLDWIEEYEPTYYTAGPTLHRAILGVAREGQAVLRGHPLRFVRSIGAAMPIPLLAELEETLHSPVLEGYGLTEAGPVTSNPLPPRVRKPGSAGVRIGLEVEIVDDSGRVLPAGCDGEILVRGPSVTPGYRDDLEANSAAFMDGWLRTGDLGRFDEDGYLWVSGRIKEMINRGGEKILPEEIEAALASHEGVEEAAAFGISHATLGEEVAAAVVARAGVTVTEAELRRFAAARLAVFKVPRRILLVDAIPKGTTGKAQRASLAARAQANADGGPPPRAAFIAPTSPVEKQIAETWERILVIDAVGINDEFFALGGDSFAASLMLATIQKEFGVLADFTEFFLEPTVAALARLIGGTNGGAVRASTFDDEAACLLALQSHGSKPPFFCISASTEDPYYFRHLASHLGGDRPFYVLRDNFSADECIAGGVNGLASRFADEIRRVTPRGPYFIGGHCFGGIVAFELARLLESRSETIGLLALFDSPAPGYPKVLRQWRHYIRQTIALPLSPGVRTRDVIKHFRLLARITRQRLGARTGIDLRIRGVPDDRLAANKVAARRFVLKPCACKVHAFLAGEEPRSERVLEDSRIGWRDFAGGGFECHMVPGGHDSMFTPPFVVDLANDLGKLLDAAPDHQVRPRSASSCAGTGPNGSGIN